MAYTKTIWKNNSILSPEAMNKIENELYLLDNKITDISKNIVTNRNE